MPIRSIEIICIPCHKCDTLKNIINEVIKNLELKNRAKILYEFKYTPHLRDITKYSVNPSQTPAVVINGNLELAGKIEPLQLKMKLEELNRF